MSVRTLWITSDGERARSWRKGHNSIVKRVASIFGSTKIEQKGLRSAKVEDSADESGLRVNEQNKQNLSGDV
jgi:hypothetical protein